MRVLPAQCGESVRPSVSAGVDVSLSLPMQETAPLGCSHRRRRPFCGSRRLAGLLSRHTLTPLLLVSLLRLHPRLPPPVSLVASSSLHVSCQLRFAPVSLPGSPNHTFLQ